MKVIIKSSEKEKKSRKVKLKEIYDSRIGMKNKRIV